MSKEQKRLAIIVLALAVIILAVAKMYSVKAAPEEDHTIKGQPKVQPAGSKEQQQATKRQQQGEEEVVVTRAQVRLQELMDDADANKAEALTLANTMIIDGTPDEKMDAIRCYEWFGGKEAVKGLLSVISNASGSLVNDGRLALQHIIERSNFEEEGLSNETWLELIQGDADPEALGHYFHLLGMMDNEKSVPILLELIESEDKNIQREAKELMTSIAGGEEINTLKEAQAWWEKYQKEQAASQQ